jgi:N-acetylmuramoyl-L-alanine amidase
MSTFALCIGHSRRGDKGAVNAKGVNEHTFNRPLANRVAELLRERKHIAHVVDQYDADSYDAAMRWVAAEVGRLRADAAVEFHFNSASPAAHGYEYLFWHSSKRAAKLAQCFAVAHKLAYPKHKFRGLKPCDPLSRGAGFLRRTPCPAVLLEPFFGSNAAETDDYTNSLETLARVYADALCTWAANKS